MSDTVTMGAVRRAMLSRNGIIVLGGLLSAMGMLGTGVAQTRARPAETTNPEALDVRLETAQTALYSLDFEIAEESYLELTRRDPKSPRFWNLLASAILFRAIFEQEKLNLDSFSGNRIGTDESTDEIAREREDLFRETVDRAIDAAETILDRDPDDLEAQYALGASHAMLAVFEATVKKSVLGAAGPAKKAHDIHMDLLRRDPSFNDARLAIGAYEYAAGVLPWAVRIIVWPFGIRGDKEIGVEQLEYASRLGKTTSIDAKMVLVVVHTREKEYEEALELLDEVHALYPRNYLLEYSSASLYEKMKRWGAAIRTYQSILGKIESGRDGYDRFEPEPMRFKMAEAYVHAERFEESIPIFETVILAPGAGDNLKARSHIWLGRLLESDAGRARAHFRAVLDLDCSEGLKKEARRHL